HRWETCHRTESGVIQTGCRGAAETSGLNSERRGKVAVSTESKVALVTGASQGIGAGVVRAFVERGYNVVASSRNVTGSVEIAASDRIALVDGDIGQPATAAKIVETALSRFGSIDVLVNNAGIFFNKPFT